MLFKKEREREKKLIVCGVWAYFFLFSCPIAHEEREEKRNVHAATLALASAEILSLSRNAKDSFLWTGKAHVQREAKLKWTVGSLFLDLNNFILPPAVFDMAQEKMLQAQGKKRKEERDRQKVKRPLSLILFSLSVFLSLFSVSPVSFCPLFRKKVRFNISGLLLLRGGACIGFLMVTSKIWDDGC